jgi:hypothetical protein
MDVVSSPAGVDDNGVGCDEGRPAGDEEDEGSKAKHVGNANLENEFSERKSSSLLQRSSLRTLNAVT